MGRQHILPYRSVVDWMAYAHPDPPLAEPKESAYVALDWV